MARKKIHYNYAGDSKICTKCHTLKHLSEYPKNKRGKNGLNAWCRKCKHFQTPEQKERASIRKREYNDRPAVKSRRREVNIRELYKIDIEVYNEFYNTQGGCCAGCGIPLIYKSSAAQVDHCHATGKVRGILCCKCNLLIARVKDNPEVFENLAKYLRKI